VALRLPDSMPWRIYQAYLQGPTALLRLFEEAFGRHALYGPPDPDQQQRTIDALSVQVGQLKAQNERLQAEASDLRGHNFQLQRRNAELEALVAKDSHNSSRPPSTDPPWAKRTRSLRRPSGRRPGGQAGHRGETLRLAARPDRTVEHRPRQCRQCHSALAEGGAVRHLRQQVVEVVPARLRVIEHRLVVLRCSRCGKTTQGEFSGSVRSGVQYGPGVKARVLYLQQYQLLPYQRTSEAMRDLFGCHLSTGSVANIVRECADGLCETELKIKKKLRRSPVIHADETGLRVEGKLACVHVASNSRLTHYAAAAGKGQTAMEEAGVLPRYRGTCVHDGYFSYSRFEQCRHSLCNAHLLRELVFVGELDPAQQGWTKPLAALLVEIKEAAAVATGQGQLGAETKNAFLCRYDRLVKRADRLNPRPPAEEDGCDPPKRKRPPATPQRRLVNRLLRRRDEVLRFMTDLTVPFTNNGAERDLRMVKAQQKVGGCFRTEEGARDFCRVRSYLSTARKQGHPLLHALERVLTGKPLPLETAPT
jgi:transposase